MFLSKTKFLKLFALIATALYATPAFAADPPGPNPLNNPLAVLLISIMIILLIAIGILAYILIGAADVRVLKKKRDEKKSVIPQAAAVFVGLMLLNISLSAQDKVGTNVPEVITTIGGLPSSTFYIMVSIIFLELLVILVMLINIRFLLKSERRKLLVEAANAFPESSARKSNWWDWFNKFKPVDQEADIDLGHEYDGIRELDNRLPPWWIYGFYLTIVIAGIYFWRYHISHTAPLSKEEYEIAVKKADERTKEFLKQKGDAVDENTVTMLGQLDIAEGKIIFQKSCVSCHLEGGAGMVGPNLTDDYWIHGGDIKSIFKTIKYGINAMPTWQNSYNNKQIAQLASYVKSLKGTNPSNAKAPQGDLYNEEIIKPVPDSVKKDNKIAAR